MRIRVLKGGLIEAEKMFKQLSAGGTRVVDSTYKGILVKLGDKAYIGFREISKSGPPTIVGASGARAQISAMKIKDVESAKGEWVRLCREEDLGLWWIAEDIRELLPGSPEEEIRRETLAALRPLMSAGVIRAANQLSGGEFEVWDGSVDQQLARIETEWLKLGRAPIIGDVVWFVGPRRWRH